MPKNIVDANTFTDPIVVPEGIDTHDTLAEFMEAFVQGLSNRTRFIKNIVDHIARVDVVNTFVREQIINAIVGSVDTPILTTQGKPGDAVDGGTAYPDNPWKLIFAAPTKGSAWSAIYVGQAPYGLLIANNARWHVPTQRWRQLDATYPSTALISTPDGFVVSRIPAGVADWQPWPNAGAGTGDLFAGASVVAGLDFGYVLPRVRVSPIHMSDVSGSYFLDGDGSIGLRTFDAGDHIRFPIRVPVGGKLPAVQALVIQGAADRWRLDVVERHVGAPLSVTTPTEVLHVGSSSSVVGANTLIGFDASAITVQPDYEYYARVRGGGASDRILRVLAVNWTDPGPRSAA